MNWLKHGIDITKIQGGKTFCPKCHHTRKNKRDRSLSVDMQNGLFNCHNAGCDFSGTAADSLLEREPKKTYVKPQPRLQVVSDAAVEYFKRRGISNNTLLIFKITEALEWMPQTGGEMPVICFNYYRNEELVNIKFRGKGKAFKMAKDAELIFYNLDALKDRKEIVICEGEIDTLSFFEAGVTNVVSVPNGASMGKNAKLEYLDNCWQEFEHIEKIVLATDADEPGQALAAELARRLGAEKCFKVSYPTGYKDANEILSRIGKEAVKRLIDEAHPLPVEGVSTVLDVIDDVKRLYQHGYPKTLSLGWSLDEYLTFTTGQFTVITGTPNAGKSTWLDNALERLARLHGWRIAMFSPEKMPLSVLIAELAQINVGMPFYRFNPVEKMSVDALTDSLNFIDSHFYFLRTEQIDITLDGLLDKAAECVKRYGVNAFVFDPWNYIEHNRPAKQTETEYISESLTKVSNFCKKYDVHVFLIAHPTKIKKDPKTDQFYVPTLYDISGSAHFYNKADNGVVIYRNHAEGCTDIYVQKVRWFFVGKVGTAKMHFHPQSQRFLDAVPMTDNELAQQNKGIQNYMQQKALTQISKP